MRRLQIGVIGTAGREEYPKNKLNIKAYSLAYEIGKLIADKNAILICGGKGGIMEQACRGAKENKGITVGVIAGNQRNKSNKYVDVEVVTGVVNSSEDAIIVSMSDGIVAIGGGSGTLQEIALAYRNNKPVIAIKGINGWADKLADKYLDERKIVKIYSSRNAQQAIDLLFKRVKK